MNATEKRNHASITKPVPRSSLPATILCVISYISEMKAVLHKETWYLQQGAAVKYIKTITASRV